MLPAIRFQQEAGYAQRAKKNPPGLRRMDFFSDNAWSQRYLDCRVAALP
ncbi:hypothetical protein BSU04_08235 [Caballeronia sordidicola]|uniref:Uncharacterized protein n=1 Tax=Caballeronia sordidicola TaxID=196367 RepID=A0A226X870_CABSO|nr:hypothetical protein BSU04_08235 [Caballeronia sordidicola]